MAVSNVLRYKTDLDRGISMQVLRTALLTGDNEAHVFMVDIIRSASAETIDLSGASVKGYFIRNDNATVVIDGHVEGKSASLSLSSACYAVPGRFSLVVKLIQGITVNAVLWVEGNVGRSNTDTIYDPDHVIPSLEELLAQISAVEAATQAANRAANYVLNTTVEAVAVPSGGNPSVDVDTVNGHMHLAFGLVSGDRGPEGPRGPVGPQGETGRGLDIKGIYPSLSALRSGVPNPEQGDMYNVGESAPYTIYMWDGIQNDWISQGVLQGAKGVTYTPIVENGIIRWENDGGLQNPPEADIRGPKGDPGTNGTNGKNGISVTHLWNGTVLEVTSASGTSSADLKGNAGANATITGVTATVDNNEGTPSVDVEMRGTESSRSFHFAFHNLKGENGKDAEGSDAADYVVASGKSGDWTYRKWNSGAAECWFSKSFTTGNSVAWGNMYESQKSLASVSYPFSLTPKYESAHIYGANMAFMSYLYAKSSGNSSPQVYAVRPNSFDSVSVTVYFYVAGTWK